jgi:cyclohexanone monooxygenase
MVDQVGTRAYDAVIVGAGFSGMYMLHKLRGMGLSARVIEAGSDVGGTWYWNRYPGARCDVRSMEYCYSWDPQLEQEWHWTERYPAQPEILRYLNHVADRYDLRRDITFGRRVTAAHYDEAANRWRIAVDDGTNLEARWCIMATGCLSAPRRPDFPGLDDFAGHWYHTGQWPHEPVDFTGQRVGLIGTGSTGIQVAPVVAAQAKHLYVFQRTPNFSIPAHNGPLDPEYERDLKSRYQAYRAEARTSLFGVPWALNMQSALQVPTDERERKFEEAWEAGGATPMLTSYVDLLTNEEANAAAADFVRRKIRSIVKDPKVADLLCPTDHPLGTKRICVDTNYYATFNRPNVTLVDVRSSPIETLTKTGLKTRDAHYELDSVIFATGFDAMTGALLAIDIRGRNGASLRDKWREGPRAYLGLAVAGFPNLFTITGPGSPSVLSNVVVSIEQHVEWISDCIARLRQRGCSTIEATREAEDRWVAHVNEVANTTLFPKANSWYTGANVPGKPRVFMPYVGGVGAYREICDRVAAQGYEGFAVG